MTAALMPHRKPEFFHELLNSHVYGIDSGCGDEVLFRATGGNPIDFLGDFLNELLGDSVLSLVFTLLICSVIEPCLFSSNHT